MLKQNWGRVKSVLQVDSAWRRLRFSCSGMRANTQTRVPQVVAEGGLSKEQHRRQRRRQRGRSIFRRSQNCGRLSVIVKIAKGLAAQEELEKVCVSERGIEKCITFQIPGSIAIRRRWSIGSREPSCINRLVAIRKSQTHPNFPGLPSILRIRLLKTFVMSILP